MNHHPIAIPIAAPTLEEALRRIPQAHRLADVIELRLDYLEDSSPDDLRRAAGRFIQATDRAVILTYHPQHRQREEARLSFQQQVALWKSLFPLAAGHEIYFDLDLALAEWFHSQHEPVPWQSIVASYHNFTETPADVFDIFDRLAALPAAVLKIATLARDISDNIPLFALLNRAQQQNRRLIALSMGEAGGMSRILTPAWGGVLTFGSLRPGEQTAAGQVTAEELCQLYRVPQLSANWNIVGIIGDPVQHSLSPLIHNRVFGDLSLEWVYVPLLVTNLESFMHDFVSPSSRRLEWNLRGLSVTLPHKVKVIPYLDRLDAVAGQVGAVNTLVVEGRELVGYNTDVEGALRPLRQRLGLKGARAVILGAGGAARAVAYGLSQEGADVTVLARNREQARRLATRFGGRSGSLTDLAHCQYDLLINATPVGLESATAQTLVPPEVLRPSAVVFDLVPRVEGTRLLWDAQAAGCIPISGLEMLVHQAARQFELWTHLPAPTEAMFQAVLAGQEGKN